MFDLGMSELLVLGVVALIVIGPKDLPGMFRTMGRFVARLRAMGREFSSAMEEAADQSGMADVARDLKAATSLRETGLDAIKDAAGDLGKWEGPSILGDDKPAAKKKRAKKKAVSPSQTQPANEDHADGDTNKGTAAGQKRPHGPATADLARRQEGRKTAAQEAAALIGKGRPTPEAPPLAASSKKVSADGQTSAVQLEGDALSAPLPKAP